MPMRLSPGTQTAVSRTQRTVDWTRDSESSRPSRCRSSTCSCCRAPATSSTTPLFLVAYMLVFREHNLKYMLATTAGLYLGSLAIFSKLLFVPLPTGNWPGFYDFSNWLLEILHAI